MESYGTENVWKFLRSKMFSWLKRLSNINITQYYLLKILRNWNNELPDGLKK